MAAIQSLWIGEYLGGMELLSIKSFLHHGHDYHLYVYDEVKNVPDGVVVKDGREILGAEFANRDRFGTFTFFADRFRYRMLLMKGGWWVDTDVICVRPFHFDETYVFGFEGADGSVNNAVLKAPAGAPLLQALDSNAFAVDDHVNWGVIGPKLLTKALGHEYFTDLRRYIQPIEVFYPFPFPEWERVFVQEYDDVCAQIPPAVHGIHLGTTMFKLTNVTSLDNRYPKRTMIGHFQHLHL